MNLFVFKMFPTLTMVWVHFSSYKQIALVKVYENLLSRLGSSEISFLSEDRIGMEMVPISGTHDKT